MSEAFRAMAGLGPESGQRYSPGGFRWPWAQRVRYLCDEKPLHNGLLMEAYNQTAHSDIQFLMSPHQ